MLCVKDCASGVWREVNGLPEIVDPAACNRCSHCIAVCPQGAIEHDALDGSRIRPPHKNLLDPAVYYEIATTRRSTRHYKEKAVLKEDIEKILDLARYSPTASNSQNVEYSIILDRTLIRKTAETVFGYAKRIY